MSEDVITNDLEKAKADYFVLTPDERQGLRDQYRRVPTRASGSAPTSSCCSTPGTPGRPSVPEYRSPQLV